VTLPEPAAATSAVVSVAERSGIGVGGWPLSAIQNTFEMATKLVPVTTSVGWPIPRNGERRNTGHRWRRIEHDSCKPAEELPPGLGVTTVTVRPRPPLSDGRRGSPKASWRW
jgi:hypothetical protein